MTATTLYFTGPREVSLRDEGIPEPDRDEVLVETAVTAVSGGTELLVYRGDVAEDTGGNESIDPFAGDFTYPLKYGYAAVGDVVAVGDDVDERWRERTVFGFNPHESHFVSDPDELVPVPNDIQSETAALLPTAETAVNLLMDGRPMIGERVVVFGAGVVGLFTASLLAEFPLERLTVVEPLASRRELAERMGADETIHPEQVDTLDTQSSPAGADLIYELTGTPDTLDDAIDAAGYDTRIVVGSWYGRKRADIDLGGFFHRGRVDLISSQVSTLAPEHRGRWTKDRRMDVAWDHLRTIETDPLITHRTSFDRAPEAYRTLDRDPEDALQVLFLFD
ncbi:MAG: zinc-binding alcohol dehydrogenase [Halobacteriales archaeon]